MLCVAGCRPALPRGAVRRAHTHALALRGSHIKICSATAPWLGAAELFFTLALDMLTEGGVHVPFIYIFINLFLFVNLGGFPPPSPH